MNGSDNLLVDWDFAHYRPPGHPGCGCSLCALRRKEIAAHKRHVEAETWSGDGHETSTSDQWQNRSEPRA